MIRMLALDIDGTLTTSERSISDRTCAAVRRAVDSGLEVVLATNRRYRSSLLIADQLGVVVPVVCVGGALVKGKARETIVCESFPAAAVQRIIQIARAEKQSLIVHHDADLSQTRDFVLDDNDPWNIYTARYFSEYESVAWVGDAQTLSARIKPIGATLFGEEQVLGAIERQVTRDCPGVVLTIIREVDGFGWSCAVSQRHVTKWTGLSRLAAVFGFTPAEVCAVGDELNDLAMIEGAGVSVAMGNAHPQVKARATWVTDSNDDDGVVTVIERLLNDMS